MCKISIAQRGCNRDTGYNLGDHVCCWMKDDVGPWCFNPSLLFIIEASDVGFWCFFWSSPETNSWANNGDPVIWDAIAIIMTSWRHCHDQAITPGLVHISMHDNTYPLSCIEIWRSKDDQHSTIPITYTNVIFPEKMVALWYKFYSSALLAIQMNLLCIGSYNIMAWRRTSYHL